MGNIHHDAQTVTLIHDLFSELRQTVVLGIASFKGGVADVIVTAVTKGDIADASIVKIFDQGKIFSDRVADSPCR